MKQSQLSQKANDFFKSLTIIYFAMLMGPIIFLFLVLFLKLSGGQIITDKFSSSYGVMVFLISFISVNGGRYLYKRLVLQAQSKMNIGEKLNAYQTSVIINLAFIEGAVLFSIVVFFLTSQVYFLLFTLVLIMIFLTIKPTRQRAIKDLKINSEQMAKASF
ncbi:hypothetical protein SAMN06265379_102401 [Saccharicrinis carchari]|uniref:Uncharacterized protein n=1 Tax=Saccharicrinis carchari TaxID=1168039 RepID=A0A521C4R1_SACCC|nr:hypothetical protein [Saccharicrinis carchari]SMO54432.1 hypothetical protein SAMN06265379_102401 [Saccharicrinis carchari]